MWLQRFTNYLLQHRWQALALTFVITFVPFLGIAGILIAALVTLSIGLIEGALFTIVATLPYFISFYLSKQPATFSFVMWAAIGVASISNVLTWAFAAMLRRKANWRLILETAALFGVLVVSVVHLAYPDVVDWWGKELSAYYTQAQTLTGGIKENPEQTELQLETINLTKHYATGLMVAAILFNAIFQLIVARWLQGLAQGLSLAKELHFIRLSPLASGLFLASFILQYLGNSVILDIMPILYTLFAAAGLSLIHYLLSLGKAKNNWFWLAVLYVSLIFGLPLSVMLIAMLAVVDSWLDLRKRFKKALK